MRYGCTVEPLLSNPLLSEFSIIRPQIHSPNSNKTYYFSVSIIQSNSDSPKGSDNTGFTVYPMQKKFFFQKYTCEKCGREFTFLGKFTNHVRSCEGALAVPRIKAFPCKKCAKTYKTLKSLKKHMKSCEGGLYACRLCGRSFATKRDVNLHERSCRYNVNNSPNKTYKCRRCSATIDRNFTTTE